MLDPQLLAPYAITVLSLIAAILAWIAKLRWSKEYAAAKDAQIESLKIQVEQHKFFNPVRLREYHESVRALLEENIQQLEQELAVAHQQLQSKDESLEELQSAHGDQTKALETIRNERQALLKRIDSLEASLPRTQQHINIADNVFKELVKQHLQQDKLAEKLKKFWSIPT